MSDDDHQPVRVSPHGVPMPCRRRCGRATILRDGRGRPLCGGCAGATEPKAKGERHGAG